MLSPELETALAEVAVPLMSSVAFPLSAQPAI